MITRNPYRVIYTSSYDRGLEHLLKIWPEVKEAVPEAELHIFYGWQLFDQGYRDNPGAMAWRQKMVELMNAEGVTEHGRVPQPKIAEEMLKSGIWAYPTHFGEINCITAQKAQAFGSIPVVINYAALQTTVQFGTKVDGDVYEKEVLEVYKDELIRALKDHKWQEEVRKPMVQWAASKFRWENTAKQWDAEFRGEPYNYDYTAEQPIVRIVDGYTGKEVHAELQTV